jgi:uncharacterized membrane protein YsdA (DUF1294 family)
MPWLYSVRFHLIFALSLCATLTVGLWWAMTSRQHTWWLWLAHWLLVVNVVTFGYYALDKWLAAKPWFRIPERVLHMLAALGGSPAALLAMRLFRHKTIKPSFRILFWSIVLVQIGLIVVLIVKWLGRD